MANEAIEGKQCTIYWCFNDNKTSHMDVRVVKKVISKIKEKFWEMPKTFQDEDDFLDMKLSLNKGKNIAVDMKTHTQKAINTADLFEV